MRGGGGGVRGRGLLDNTILVVGSSLYIGGVRKANINKKVCIERGGGKRQGLLVFQQHHHSRECYWGFRYLSPWVAYTKASTLKLNGGGGGEK